MPSAFDLYEFYLQAADLQGRSITTTIAGVVVKDVWDPRRKHNEKRLVLSFVGKKKKLPLNKTQAAAVITAARSDDYARWVGVAVILTPGQATNAKDTIIITPAPAPAGNGEIAEPAAGKEESAARHLAPAHLTRSQPGPSPAPGRPKFAS